MDISRHKPHFAPPYCMKPLRTGNFQRAFKLLDDDAAGGRSLQLHNGPSLTIDASANRPVRVKWINDLVDANGNYLPHQLPVDPTLHWANPPVELRDVTRGRSSPRHQAATSARSNRDNPAVHEPSCVT